MYRGRYIFNPDFLVFLCIMFCRKTFVDHQTVIFFISFRLIPNEMKPFSVAFQSIRMLLLLLQLLLYRYTLAAPIDEWYDDGIISKNTKKKSTDILICIEDINTCHYFCCCCYFVYFHRVYMNLKRNENRSSSFWLIRVFHTIIEIIEFFTACCLLNCCIYKQQQQQ